VDAVVVGDQPEKLTLARKDFESMWIH
jgi:hypothetical protein